MKTYSQKLDPALMMVGAYPGKTLTSLAQHYHRELAAMVPLEDRRLFKTVIGLRRPRTHT